MESNTKPSGSQNDGRNAGAQGIDVSHHSGDIDWARVKVQDICFAFVKVTEGDTFVDPKFAENWAGMAHAGIIRGAYHYWVVGDDPKSQANNFINQVHLLDGDLPPVLDVEQPGNQSPAALAHDLQVWLDLVQRHYGTQPLINTDPDFWDTYVQADFGTVPLWVSNTGVASPHLPQGWKEWVFWQYEQNVEVQGVPKGADRSLFQGTLDQLCRFVQSSRLRKKNTDPSNYRS